MDLAVIQTANVKPAITQSVEFYVSSLSLYTSIHPLTRTWLLIEDHMSGVFDYQHGYYPVPHLTPLLLVHSHPPV